MGLVENHPHTWPGPLQPLEHRDFRWLWVGTLVSNAGSWMQRVATAWLVYSLTGSPVWLGIDAFASGIPTVILLPFGGVVADRVDRRRVLMVGNLFNCLIAGVLAVFWWLGILNVWMIVGASFLGGVIASVMVPASQSVLPKVVGEDHLSGAIALNSLQYNLARGLGPALGGVALAVGGPGWCFALNAVSFLALVGAFAVIRQLPQPSHDRKPVWVSIREGVGFMRAHSDVRVMLVMVGVLAFFGAPVVTMLPAVAKDILHLSSDAFSILLTSFGAGAATAGIALMFMRLKRVMVTVSLAAAGVAGCQIGLGMVHDLTVAALIVGLAGAGFVGAMIELGTGLMTATADAFRGRVSSVQQLFFRAAQPLGALVAGIGAHYFGLGATLGIFGALLLLFVAVVCGSFFLGIQCRP